MASAPTKVFARDATGFVKELGFLDHFLISQGIVLIINGFVATVFFAPYLFPGANLYVDFALGGIPALCMAYVYGRLSAGIARSGGDYVWSTRIAGPIYGTIQMVFVVAALVYFNIFNIWQMFTVAVGPTLFGIGAAEGSKSLISTGTMLSQAGWGLPLSLLVLLAIVVIGLIGIRAYAWFCRVTVPIYLLIVVIFIATLLLLSTSAIQTSFDKAMSFAGVNATYNSVISTATSSSTFSPTSFNVGNTLLAAIPWGFLTYVGFNWSSYSAGETKNAKTGIIGRAFGLSVILTMIVLEFLTYLVYSRFGQTFVNSVSYVAGANTSLFPVFPLPNFILTLANPTVGAIVAGALFIGWMINSCGLTVFSSRMLFAASFDRILPTKLSDVSDRWHTPHFTVILMGVLSGIYLVLYWLAGGIAAILNTSIVVPIGLLLPLLAAFLFPIIKRDLYIRVYGSMKSAWLMSLAGLVGAGAFAIYAISETSPLVSGAYLGANLALAYEVVAALIVIGLAIYGYGRSRMTRMGINPKAVFGEIPPE